MRKRLVRIVALATCVVTVATTTVFGFTMKDVGTSHWAYNEIIEMQRRGLLVSSSQGEFFPNNYVTFFELSQILAKVAGYQDELITPNMDAQLKQAIRDNYAKQKPTIEAYQKNYQYWQKDANEEIAYLLGKGYLQKEDLGKFMSKSTSGTESKRGVRKQEAAVYLVRLLHKAETAKQQYSATGFVDETSIHAENRPYVAYLKSLGIVNGNEKNQFNPTEPITRATLSKMLIDTLKIKENQVENPVVETPGTVTNQALEGKLTKMISKGDSGYYVVLEVDPTRIHTYSMESTAMVKDKSGATLSLASLKSKIDGSETIHATVQVALKGTTEHITAVQLMNDIVVEKPIIDPPVVVDPGPVDTTEKEDNTVSVVTGNIYSILIGPKPEITLQLSDGTSRKYELTPDADIYSHLIRRNITIWDLRLNQQVELQVINRQIKVLDVKKAAPPVTLTGTISRTSVKGDEIEVYVAFDPVTQVKGVTRKISVPMTTQIIEGTIQRSRKDLKEDMKVVVIYGEEAAEPEQIIIVSN